MSLSVLGGLALGGVSALGSIAGNLVSSHMQRYNDNVARQWQEDMYNRSNDYNSPVSMMARMKQAGINPNLIAGQGVAPAASVPSASQGSRAPSFDDVAPSVVSSAHMFNEDLATRADARLKSEQARALQLENDAKEEYGKTYGYYSHEMLGDIVKNPDGTVTLPEISTTYHPPRNAYEQRLVDEFLRNKYEIQNTEKVGTIQDEEIKKTREETRKIQLENQFASERSKYAAQIIAQEIESGRLNNQQAAYALASLLPDVIRGLGLKDHVTFDAKGYPVSVSNYDKVLGEITHFLESSGLGSIVDLVLSFLPKGRKP